MKTAGRVALVLLVLLGVVVTRAFFEGRAALAGGDAAVARGDSTAAVDAWRRAARWYVPGAGHVGAAYERLVQTGTEAEARGDIALALAAWRGVRSSVLATRSTYVPYEELLVKANQRIAALMARIEDPALAPGQTEAQRTAWHLGLLERYEHPQVGWTILALLGFAAWVGGGFWFAWRGVTSEDRLDRRIAARSGGLVAVGLLVWMAGLYFA